MGHGAIQRCTTGTNPHDSWGCTMLYNDSPSPWVMGLYNIVQLSVTVGNGAFSDPEYLPFIP